MVVGVGVVFVIRIDFVVYKYVDFINSCDFNISKFYVGDIVCYLLQVVNNGLLVVSGVVLIDVVEFGLEGLIWICSVVWGDVQCLVVFGIGFFNFSIF